MNKIIIAILLVAGLMLAGYFLGKAERGHAGKQPANDSSTTTAALAAPALQPHAGSNPAVREIRKDSSSPASVTSTGPATGTLSSVEQWLRNPKGERLTRQQVEPYLRQNQRSAASLLAAARLTGEKSYLREAAEHYPADPQVLLDVLLSDAATPNERRQALDAFRQATPDNALGDYLSALDHFKNGRAEAALVDMWQAQNKSEMEDYFLNAVQDAEEAYRAAGYSPTAAAIQGFYGVVVPQISQLNDLSKRLLAVQQQYARANDAQSAQVVMEMGLRLGAQTLEQMGGTYLLAECIGLDIEKRFLQQADPDAVLADNDCPVRERLAEIAQWREALKGVEELPADEYEMISFIQRTKIFGEWEAIRWLKNRHASGNSAP